MDMVVACLLTMQAARVRSQQLGTAIRPEFVVPQTFTALIIGVLLRQQ